MMIDNELRERFNYTEEQIAEYHRLDNQTDEERQAKLVKCLESFAISRAKYAKS